MKQTRSQLNKGQMAFTKRLGDSYLSRSIKKGSIIVPNDFVIEDKALFIFDDITPLGIAYPKELVDILAQNNQPAVVYAAQDLATKLAKILPPSELTVFDGGGILAYLFLKRAGYQGVLTDIVRVNRTYIDGRPVCKLANKPNKQPTLLLDDILASGQTIVTLLEEMLPENLSVGCLLASSNVPQGTSNLRERQGSTLCGVNKLYCARFVNGVRVRKDCQQKPAILSLRYLITKAADNKDYAQGYLIKKFGGEENVRKITALIRDINREPVDLLRQDPYKFLEKYETEVQK